MANTIETQVLFDGDRKLHLHIHLESDGVTGEETDTLLVDASAYNCDEFKILAVQGSLIGFSAELLWDATTNIHAQHIPDYDYDGDWHISGGIGNNSGVGKTGDILFTTTGFAAAGDTGHIDLLLRKVHNN